MTNTENITPPPYSKPLITIFSPLYNKNKSNWLESYAEGLAKQTFLDKMKIVIIDNQSTDGSWDVIKELVKKYNLPAELIQNEKNIGLIGSVIKFYRMLNTKYFAVLDLDDYYTSPDKVKKAVEFLEEHGDYSAYACNKFREYSDGTKEIEFDQNIPSQTFDNILRTPFFQTSSITFRNFFTPRLVDLMEGFSEYGTCEGCRGDTFRFVLAAHFGKFYYDNSADSTYRCGIGIFGSRSPVEGVLLNMIVHNDLFRFVIKSFGMTKPAFYCLNLSWNYYNQTIENLCNVLKNVKGEEFKIKKPFGGGFIGFEGILKLLMEYREFFAKTFEENNIKLVAGN